jgi:hypothetical protein
MRKLTLIAVGVVLAAGSMAWAMPISVPVGPFVIKYQNYDEGTTYPLPLPGGVSVAGVAAVDAIPGQAPATGALVVPALDPLTGAAEPYAGATEDAWAVFRVTSIENEGGTITYWQNGDGGKELVGMLYGLVDTAVNAAGTTVFSDGYHMDIYEQPLGTWAGFGGPGQGTAGRVAFEKYTGVGFDGAGVAIPGSAIQLHAFAAGGLPGWSASIDFDAALAAAYAGGVFTYSHRYDLIPGVAKMVTDSVPGFPLDPFLKPSTWVEAFATGTSDLFVTAVTSPNGPNPPPVGDWDLRSNDPVRAHGQIIPEPITMLGMCMGAFGLGRYIRRRRRR